MKRILHVVSVLERGGTEAFIMNNYRALDRSRFQFDFLVFQRRDYPYLEEIRNLGGRVFFVEMIPSLKNLPAFSRRFREIAAQYGPFDAVHTHVNLRNAFPLLAAADCGIPLRISHAHATMLGKTRGLKAPGTLLKQAMIRRYATRWLACSEAAGEALYGARFFSERGTIIPNGIEVHRFLSVQEADCVALREEWKIPADCPLVVGNITRFDANKNGEFTIRVFAELLRRVPGAILIMGGPDAGRLDACKELAQELEISENLRFVGVRGDIPRCLRLIDFYLFPSLTEGLGIALLEAQAAGCFCVASSSVSHATDIGLGSVLFYDLQLSADAWAEAALCAYRRWTPPSDATVQERFAASGYAIESAVQQLAEVYAPTTNHCCTGKAPAE